MAATRMLVVDDDPQVLETVSAYFLKHGYEVSSAKNTSEAEEILLYGGIQLMILDIVLAGEDGLAFLSATRVTRPDLKVLMFTGMGYDLDLMTRALAGGADGYIGKGMPFEDLLNAVQRVLAN